MSNSTWMTNLNLDLREMPIIHLAIPGSHNSMTYGINSRSKVAPDAEGNIKRLNVVFPWFVRRWCKNQDADVRKQLELGVRYFDLRVAQAHGRFFYSHALFSMEIFEPLLEIVNFVDENPGEVVILDFQHFYDVKFHHHIELHKRFLMLFNKRLYTTTDGPLSECTLNRCRKLQKNIILIYRRCPILLPFEFWSSQSWPTPWPNLSSVKALRSYLQTALRTRKPLQGYVTQCILTPSGLYIAKRCFSSLERTAKRVNKKLHPWISMQCPGSFKDNQPPKVNVFIADFVDLHNGEFCKWVISLNEKLCQICKEENNNQNAPTEDNTKADSATGTDRAADNEPEEENYTNIEESYEEVKVQVEEH